MPLGSIALSANPKTRPEVWAYIKAKWDVIYGRLSGNMVVLDRYLKNTLAKFADAEVEKDIQAFFEGKNKKGFDKGLAQVSDTIKGNAKYKERDEGIVKEWLEAKGY